MAVMTSKERITVAMRGGTPDQVPVTPGLSEIIPVQKFTNDYIEFFMKAQIPLWKARVEVESDFFGADSFLHVAPDASPEDPECVQTVTKETADEMFFTRTHRTAAGDLTADYYIARTALGVGDQTPANTPDENIFAMVESGRQHGRYD